MILAWELIIIFRRVLVKFFFNFLLTSRELLEGSKLYGRQLIMLRLLLLWTKHVYQDTSFPITLIYWWWEVKKGCFLGFPRLNVFVYCSVCSINWYKSVYQDCINLYHFQMTLYSKFIFFTLHNLLIIFQTIIVSIETVLPLNMELA